MAYILVVDDDAAIRKLMKTLLSAEGHEVRESSSGVGVVEQHCRTPFDLIVLDIIMPDKEGLETLMELRRCEHKTNVLAVSGGGYGGVLDFLPVAEKMGATKVLKKPFSREDFLVACRELLE